MALINLPSLAIADLIIAANFADGLQHRTHETAIDPDGGSSDVAGLARRQESHQVRQLPGFPDAPHRDLVGALGQRLLDGNTEFPRPCCNIFEHAIAEQGAGTHVIDQNAGSLQLHAGVLNRLCPLDGFRLDERRELLRR